MMFFSGMVGGEIMQLVDLWSQMDVGGCIFACAVPNNWETPVRDLIDEIADDHKLMMEREREAQAAGETVRMDAQ
jgi:trans-aconitate methyltransferase